VRLITGAIADACVAGMARRREFQQQRDRDSNSNDGRDGGRQGGRPGNDAQVVYAGGRGGRGGSDSSN